MPRKKDKYGKFATTAEIVEPIFDTRYMEYGATSTTQRRDADFPFDYVPYLIANLTEDVDNPNHLELNAELDPVCTFIAKDVSKEAVDDGFFWIDSETEKKVNDEKTTKIFELNKKLKFEEIFSDAVVKARTFGWSILALGEDDLASYSPKETRVAELDEFGNPKLYEVTISQEKKIVLKSEQVIHLVSEISYNKSYEMKGISVLKPVWSNVILLRWISYASSEFAARLGAGLLHVKTNAKNRGDLLRIWAMYKGMNSRKLVVTGADIEEIRAALAEVSYGRFKELQDAQYDQISSGSAIPSDIIKGVSQGRITGSEVNERGLFRKLDVIQKHFSKYVYQFLDYYGLDYSGLKIRWEKEFKITELQKVEIQASKLDSAIKMKSLGLFSKNQILESLGYKKRDEPEFEEIIEARNPWDAEIEFKDKEGNEE